MNFLKWLLWGLSLNHYIVDPGAGGGGGGGAGGATGGQGAAGGAGASGGSGAGGQKDGGTGTDPGARIAALETQIADMLKAMKGGSSGGQGGGTGDDPDLQARARAAREGTERDVARTKQLESALKFNLGSAAFLKQHEGLLPKEVNDIFAQADKENFADAIEKDGAVKAGLVQTFFSVQSNVDMLTAGQKASLDEYLKLTKSGKQEKAQGIYDMVFEPAFEMLKRVKKAEALQRGHASSSGIEDEYRKRLMGHSRKHYLGEKADA